MQSTTPGPKHDMDGSTERNGPLRRARIILPAGRRPFPSSFPPPPFSAAARLPAEAPPLPSPRGGNQLTAMDGAPPVLDPCPVSCRRCPSQVPVSALGATYLQVPRSPPRLSALLAGWLDLGSWGSSYCKPHGPRHSRPRRDPLPRVGTAAAASGRRLSTNAIPSSSSRDRVVADRPCLPAPSTQPSLPSIHPSTAVYLCTYLRSM